MKMWQTILDKLIVKLTLVSDTKHLKIHNAQFHKYADF